MYYSIQYKKFIKIEPWLDLTFSICLHNQLSRIHLLSHIKECKCLKKVIYQTDNKNELLFLSADFMSKFELVVALTKKYVLSERFRFKVTRKSIGSSNKRY